MNRRFGMAAALLVLVLGIAGCRPADGGAGGSPSPEPSTAAESNAAPAAPTATMGSDYGY